MSTSWHIDDHELVELELDLSRAPLRIQFGAQKVVKHGARMIDAAMTEDASGHHGNYFGDPHRRPKSKRHWPTPEGYDIPLEDHVSHEMVGRLEAEIGIEAKGAGKLAHIIVHGSVNNAPAYDYMAGPRRTLPLIVSAAADEAEDAALGRKGKGQ